VWREEMIVSYSQLLFLSSCSREVEGRVGKASILLVMIDETRRYLYYEWFEMVVIKWL
jgi:hypothetical protein